MLRFLHGNMEVGMGKLLVVLLFGVLAWGQDKPAGQPVMPSKEEVSELVSKADEKVSGFEEAVGNARPHLDRINPKLVLNYTEAASTAHTIIKSIQKNGPSAYTLVSLLATLDDLALDASTASGQLLKTDEEQVTKGKQPDVGRLSSVILLNTSGTACNDIAELILHATLRYVDAEERVLGTLLEKQN
jgi:hypothetical protein